MQSIRGMHGALGKDEPAVAYKTADVRQDSEDADLLDVHRLALHAVIIITIMMLNAWQHADLIYACMTLMRSHRSTSA